MLKRHQWISRLLLVGLLLISGIGARAQVTFPIPTADATGANVRLSGYWITSSGGGHTWIQAVGNQSQIDTKITLTTATISSTASQQ